MLCKVAALVAALSHGVLSWELACRAAQEVLVAPLLQSLLSGVRAGFRLAHILKCFALFERMLWSIQGCQQGGKDQSWSSLLAQIPVFLLNLLLVSLLESSE